MRKLFILLLAFAYCTVLPAQQLLVRGDDIGCTHASNVGVIKSYTDGIERSAELMVVTPWLPEAVKMLKENPGLDVGLHVAITSEWDMMKWRPLTQCPSITDENGYFFPFIFPNPEYPGGSLTEVKDKIIMAEVEAEIRAQIELAKRLIPDLTHISGHMMPAAVSNEIADVFSRLSKEYGLPFVDSKEVMDELKIEMFPMQWGLSPAERKANFIKTLEKLEKGKTYLYVEHPAIGGEEMEAIWHKGYENVSTDRQAVTDMFTDPEVKQLINEKGIKLVSYGDMIRTQTK